MDPVMTSQQILHDAMYPMNLGLIHPMRSKPGSGTEA